jgi:hypothetical protein
MAHATGKSHKLSLGRGATLVLLQAKNAGLLVLCLASALCTYPFRLAVYRVHGRFGAGRGSASVAWRVLAVLTTVSLTVFEGLNHLALVGEWLRQDVFYNV